MRNKKSNLIYVFVHGTSGWGSYDERYRKMPYWGMRGGDLLTYLREKGFECYASSVSPFGSAWDCACELYAQLHGKMVDYGSSHSAHFKHARYRKDFAECPLVTDWDEETKLVLIGHSFGGTTARFFAELMANGDEEERKNANDSEVSSLFLGNQGHRIHAVVAVATAMNGNSVFDMVSDPEFDMNSVKVPWWCRPFERRMSDKLNSRSDLNPEDCGDFDMQIDHAVFMNRRMTTLPDVYYFSVPCCFSVEKGDRYVPERGMEPFFVMRSFQMGAYSGATKGGTIIDERWHRNDGRVNTISELAPFGAPQKELDPNDLLPGIWNIYPTHHGDHMSLQGGLLHKKDIREFYLKMLTMIADI